MIVKICGITRQQDAEAAVALGAHAIGFVFWPKSPRFVDPFRARDIAAALPPFVTPVGVFVDQPVEYVNAVVSLVGLGAAQLHGDETIEMAAAVRRPVIKAIGVGDGAAAVEWPDEYTLLLDVHDRERHGGTGRIVDWTRASEIAATRKVILAGGLTPDNVGAAIDRVRPFGIDVSSGVERSAGVKDPARLKSLFEALHDHQRAARS